MDDWNTKYYYCYYRHHIASGLYQSCIASNISIEQAENHIIEYLKSKGIMKGQMIVAGNSVHQDKRFLYQYMPELSDFLHYRILDVSSIKIVVNSLHPNLFYKKKNCHRAVDDIMESI